MKKYAFIAIASVAFLTSCNDTKKAVVTEEATTTAMPANTEGQPAQEAAVPATATAEGLNPEHGQPGHRCDIQVGAPLNSPAGAQPTATTAQAPAAQPFLVNDGAKAAGASTASGNLNPAHGQPGHRCDIAVGQPLS